jgi:LysM repeat protein
VQSPRWLIVALSAALLTALAALVACGGGSDGEQTSNDRDEIPTATLPASLPEPVILGESQVPPGGGSTYTVQDGDSPSSIAEQFGITAEELMVANGITDPLALFVGQVLTIPGASSPPQATEPAPAEPTSAPVEEVPTATGEQTYTVQEGDIPETIAAQFGITAEELMAANGITDPTSLHVGDVLIIPAPSGG